ncbi:MAG: hypothetical protein WBB96_04380, partial [Candidatus Dechloromonas phosphoritropha]
GGIGAFVYCLKTLDVGDISKRPEDAAGPNVIRCAIGKDVADFQFVEGLTTLPKMAGVFEMCGR